MSDKFTSEYEKLKRLEKLVDSDIKKRNEFEKNNKPTSIIEAGIRGQFEEIKKVISSIKTNQIEGISNLPHHEVNRRHKLVQDIENSVNRMNNDYEKHITKILKEKNKQNLLLNSNKEEESDRTLIGKISTEEMMQLQRKKIDGQNEMLDELHGLLIDSKMTNRAIGDEIRAQAPMLKNLENQIDSTDSRIKRATKKLNLYYEKSSNTCLMTTICIEIIILLVIVLAF